MYQSVATGYDTLSLVPDNPLCHSLVPVATGYPLVLDSVVSYHYAGFQM